MKKVYKPGTRRLLSPRDGIYSVRWGRLVMKTANLAETKDLREEVAGLWRDGYSHKDAAHILLQRRDLSALL